MIAAPALFYRLAAVALLIVAGLALSGCGRKGPLDAPPGGLAANPDGSLDEETAAGGEVIRRGSRARPADHQGSRTNAFRSTSC